jgi:hypothetical protein
MTKEQMYNGGLTMTRLAYTDEELPLAIETTTLVIAYLKGRGPLFHLAYSPLTKDLEMLQSFAKSRGLKN